MNISTASDKKKITSGPAIKDIDSLKFCMYPASLDIIKLNWGSARNAKITTLQKMVKIILSMLFFEKYYYNE